MIYCRPQTIKKHRFAIHGNCHGLLSPSGATDVLMLQYMAVIHLEARIPWTPSLDIRKSCWAKKHIEVKPLMCQSNNIRHWNGSRNHSDKILCEPQKRDLCETAIGSTLASERGNVTKLTKSTPASKRPNYRSLFLGNQRLAGCKISRSWIKIDACCYDSL